MCKTISNSSEVSDELCRTPSAALNFFGQKNFSSQIMVKKFMANQLWHAGPILFCSPVSRFFYKIQP